MTKLQELNQQIAAKLTAANGRRRERLIGHSEVIQVLREALDWDRYGYANGGFVANAYKYSATTSAAYAIRFAPGHIALKIGEVNGHGSSETTWATGCMARNLAGQRAAFGPRTDDYRYAAILLTKRQALALIRQADTFENANILAKVLAIPHVDITAEILARAAQFATKMAVA